MFALHTGASGLRSYGEGMTVVGSNISNVNTVGYKSNRVNFQDMLATSMGGSGGKIGKGVKIGSIQGDFSQGNLLPTTMTTDLAVDGEGFFTLRDTANRTLYTRAGNFKFDKEGFVVTPEGRYLMVRDVDPDTNEATGFPHPAKLLGLNSPPKATGDGTNRSGINVAANLNAEAGVPAVQFDPTNVQTDMYNSSSTVTVIDQNGGEHVVNIVFRKQPDQQSQIDPATGLTIPGTGMKNVWTWYAVSDAAEFGGTPNVLVATSGGFLRFTDNGRMIGATNGRFTQPGAGQVGPDGQLIPPGPPVLVDAGPDGGTPIPQITLPYDDIPLVVGMDFGLGSNPDDLADSRTGLDGLTQFSADFKIHRLEADGNTPGSLEDIEIDRSGTVLGHFDNGDSRALNRVMLTRFVSPENLLRRGEALFEESISSGKPIAGNPAVGAFGNVRSRNLERSNVDLAKEFVRMIETQRAFQANAKSVTTSDEMLADLVSMKR